jgi:hypothetical protein
MALFAEKTKVPVAKTRMDIEHLLEKHKAAQYGTAVDYEQRLARVQFKLHNRIVRFMVSLPDRKKFRSELPFAQAERQKWRALLLVIKAKLEAVENSISTFEEEFLAYIVMPNDSTVAEHVLPLIEHSYRTGLIAPQLLLPPATDC